MTAPLVIAAGAGQRVTLQAISAPGDGFDNPRRRRAIAQCGAYLLDEVVHALTEGDARRVAADDPADLVMGHDLAGAIGEQCKKRGRLWLEARDETLTIDFAADRIELRAIGESIARHLPRLDVAWRDGVPMPARLRRVCGCAAA